MLILIYFEIKIRIKNNDINIMNWWLKSRWLKLNIKFNKYFNSLLNLKRKSENINIIKSNEIKGIFYLI